MRSLYCGGPAPSDRVVNVDAFDGFISEHTKQSFVQTNPVDDHSVCHHLVAVKRSNGQLTDGQLFWYSRTLIGFARGLMNENRTG